MCPEPVMLLPQMPVRDMPGPAELLDCWQPDPPPSATFHRFCFLSGHELVREDRNSIRSEYLHESASHNNETMT